jgi:hypothetical protein
LTSFIAPRSSPLDLDDAHAVALVHVEGDGDGGL